MTPTIARPEPPAPKVETVKLFYFDNEGCAHGVGTINLIDGEPDLSSINLRGIE